METLFWVSATLLFYIYFGYPLLLWLLSKVVAKPVRPAEILPSVSVLLSAFNEEKVLVQKVENLLSLDYPKDRLEILVGSDGSTDRTIEILKWYQGHGVQLHVEETRGGKPRMLNLLAKEAKGDILVLTDARQRIDRQAVRELVKNFNDPTVGCVSGELIFRSHRGSVGEGVGRYWSYEKFIRQKESDLDSVIGATGALYAVRRLLYTPVPEETVLDDVYLPMKVVAQGFRTLFEPKALVFDDASQTPRQEYDRKVRTLAGNYQSFVQLAGMLNPLKSRVAFQFISHKLLRILAPFFLLTLFVATLPLREEPFYHLFLMGQLLFYGLALLGAVVPGRIRRLVSTPYVFCLLNVSALVGLYRYLTGRQQVTWKTQ